MVRALAMMSGGLDSVLAAKLMKDQGVDVIGICFSSYFFNADNAVKMAKQIGVPLEVIDFSKEHFEMVKNPPHGYGKNMNPCIDCHAMMMNWCGKMLDKYKADFIITGEVLNQRPMSQTRSSLDIVKKESGFGNKILRPLCAKNIMPTEMETSGLIDREKLLAISGRNRKIQMQLADEWGIKDYPSPAGGCKLTEPNYSKRLEELLTHNSNPEKREVELLKFGRHFRLSDSAKIISSRTGDEGDEIKKLLNEKDMLFFAENYSGSLITIIGEPKKEDIIFAAKVTARYSKGKDNDTVSIKYGYFNHRLNEQINVKPASEGEIKQYSLN